MRLAFYTRLAAVAAIILATVHLNAQEAKFTVQDDCVAFAFAPDGKRIVYATRRFGKAAVKAGKKEQKVPTEYDDLWEVSLNGHERRLVDGSKLAKGPSPFSFAIRDIRIAPDNRKMTVEMTTRTLAPKGPEAGQVKSGELTELMDSDGKEISIEGSKTSWIEGATNAAWLPDGQTVVYSKEANGNLLYTLAYLRPASGAGGAMMAGHYFAAVALSPAHNVAAAIERDQDLGGPIRLVWIDLVHQSERTLAILDGFNGQLTVSPSATKVAYFRDGDTLAIRSIANPEQVTQFQVPYGRYEWSRDETHLLLKRGPANQTNQLIWISLPGGQYQNIYHGLLYHNFHISPDGRWVAVTEPGEQMLKLFPAP